MPITDERALIEKLLRIEALHAGATTPGERAAAANAMDRIRERLEHNAPTWGRGRNATQFTALPAS